MSALASQGSSRPWEQPPGLSPGPAGWVPTALTGQLRGPRVRGADTLYVQQKEPFVRRLRHRFPSARSVPDQDGAPAETCPKAKCARRNNPGPVHGAGCLGRPARPPPPAAAGLTERTPGVCTAKPQSRPPGSGGALPGNAPSRTHLSTLTDLGSICPTSTVLRTRSRVTLSLCACKPRPGHRRAKDSEGRLHAGLHALKPPACTRLDPEAGPDLSAPLPLRPRFHRTANAGREPPWKLRRGLG